MIKKTVTYFWKDLSESYKNPTFVLVINNQRFAVVNFIGGHVERPSAWYVSMRDVSDSESYMSLRDAQIATEEHFYLRDSNA